MHGEAHDLMVFFFGGGGNPGVFGTDIGMAWPDNGSHAMGCNGIESE